MSKSAARRNQAARNFWGRCFDPLHRAGRKAKRKTRWRKIYEREVAGGGIKTRR